MKNIMDKLKKVALGRVIVSSLAISANGVYQQILDYKSFENSVYSLGDKDMVDKRLQYQQSNEYVTSIKNLQIKLLSENPKQTYEELKVETLNQLNQTPSVLHKKTIDSYEEEIENKMFDNLSLDYIKYIKETNGNKVFDNQSFNKNLSYFNKIISLKHSTLISSSKLSDITKSKLINEIIINESQFSKNFKEFEENFKKDFLFLTKMYKDNTLNVNNLNIEKLKIDYISKYEKTENKDNIFNNGETDVYDKFKKISDLTRKNKEFENLIKSDYQNNNYNVAILDKDSSVTYLKNIKNYIEKIPKLEVKAKPLNNDLAMNN